MNLESMIARRAGKVNIHTVEIRALTEVSSGGVHLVLVRNRKVRQEFIPAHMRKALEHGTKNAPLDNKLRL